MLRSWIIIGWATFFILLFFNGRAAFFAHDSTDAYYLFALTLARHFPISLFLLAGLYALPALALYYLSKHANPSDSDHTGPLFSILGVLLGALLVAGSLAGAKYNLIETRCGYVTSLCTPNGLSFLDLVVAFLGLFASVPYFFSWLIFIPALVGVLIAGVPIWVTSCVALTTTHPAAPIVKRSGHTISHELARVLEAQLIDDDRAARLFHEMGQLRQMMWRARYNRRTEESRGLRETLQAQCQAWQADTDLMGSAIHRDRSRAARYDR